MKNFKVSIVIPCYNSWKLCNQLLAGLQMHEFENIEEAILREKQLKKWNRPWKIELIEGSNPTWRDLYQDFA